MNIVKLFGKLLPVKRSVPKPQMVLFGLGNPGEKYHNTRHNIGFRIIDALEGDLEKKCVVKGVANSLLVWGSLANRVAVLVKPQTFMNRSGEAVRDSLNFYGVSLSECLVVVDDFNLPFGTVRFRKGGSHGGHNGLKSIAALAGTQYPRLRVGVGPLPPKIAVIDFVLGEFSEQEEQILQKLIPETVKAVRYYLDNGIDQAMNRFNSVVID